MKEQPIKELELTVTANEFQTLLNGAGAIQKKVSKLWSDRLTKKTKKNKGEKFKDFDLVRVTAHGLGEFTAPITRLCKTSIGVKPNTTPVFAIKINIFEVQRV